MEKSEFGRGLVVCLAKFSEHLQEHGPYSERMIREYDRWDLEEKSLLEEATKYPTGDAAQKLGRMRLMEISRNVRDGSKEKAISSAIEMMMNAASDHFYDLDRERAPEPLIELADLTLTMGHGFTGRTWTVNDLDKVRDLWKRSCLELDEMLGTQSEWGEW